MIKELANKIIPGFVLSIFLLTACSRGTVLQVQGTLDEKETQLNSISTIKPFSTGTPAPSPTNTAALVPTISQPSQTPTIAGLPVFPSGSKVQVDCLNTLSTLPEGLAGILPIEPLQISPETPAYLLDLKSGERKTIPNEKTISYGPAVSPNGNWVAYTITIASGSNDLIVAGSDGKISRMIPMAMNWWWYFWLNDTHLLIDTGSQYPTDFILLNPFTGDQKLLKSQYPGIYVYGRDTIWGKYDATVYDPTQILVFYAATLSNSSGIILWDLQKQEEITRISTDILNSSASGWSPDGSLFTLTTFQGDNPRTAQIYNRAGKHVYQFDLTPYLPDFSPGTFTWSPDGRYLAFSLSTDENNVSTGLGIFETKTQAIILFCFPDKGIDFEINNIIWSPDDQHMVIENGDLDSDRVILLDLPNKTAVQIAENSLVGGWMVSPDK